MMVRPIVTTKCERCDVTITSYQGESCPNCEHLVAHGRCPRCGETRQVCAINQHCDRPRYQRPAPTSYRDECDQFHPGPGTDGYCGHLRECHTCFRGFATALERGERWTNVLVPLPQLPPIATPTYGVADRCEFCNKTRPCGHEYSVSCQICDEIDANNRACANTLHYCKHHRSWIGHANNQCPGCTLARTNEDFVNATALIRLRRRRPWPRYVVGATIGIGAALVPTAVAACAVVGMFAILIAVKRWAPESALPTARSRR